MGLDSPDCSNGNGQAAYENRYIHIGYRFVFLRIHQNASQTKFPLLLHNKNTSTNLGVAMLPSMGKGFYNSDLT